MNLLTSSTPNPIICFSQYCSGRISTIKYGAWLGLILVYITMISQNLAHEHLNCLPKAGSCYPSFPPQTRSKYTIFVFLSTRSLSNHQQIKLLLQKSVVSQKSSPILSILTFLFGKRWMLQKGKNQRRKWICYGRNSTRNFKGCPPWTRGKKPRNCPRSNGSDSESEDGATEEIELCCLQALKTFKTSKRPDSVVVIKVLEKFCACFETWLRSRRNPS